MDSPETLFVAAVLTSDLGDAQQALALVDDADLTDHRLRQIVQVARTLVADGVAPHPVAVFGRARSTGVVTGAAEVHDLQERVADLYLRSPIPAAWGFWAHELREYVLRCRFHEAADRFHQAADGESLESLRELVDREHISLRLLLDRLTQAPTSLRAVP
ncbi:hypothetical protein [Geodermatophilus amargosae]|uniref:hypothetical protein n=1 Tax=Geodermatophilus amargosae TaxID=1296565 RepID=UPI000B8555EE|nr:hypothetical protein [Geodermatophilus amargosae]